MWEKSFVYGKSKRKWWIIYFYFIFKIMLISIFVFDMVINFKFLFYVENFIIIILVKWDNLSNYVIFRVL